MSELIIDGYGDDLTVNGVRIGDLTPLDHENIELNILNFNFLSE